jgi:hypothetical protein
VDWDGVLFSSYTNYGKKHNNPNFFHIVQDTVYLRKFNYKNYVTEKHPNFEMYKVITTSNDFPDIRVDIIGIDSHTNTSYNLRLPPSYYKKPIMECIQWSLNIDKNTNLVEV